jgi:hypothetical protein
VKDLPAELGGGHSSAPFPLSPAAPAPAPEPPPAPAAEPVPAPEPRPLAELLDELYARLAATGEPVLPFLEREMNARARQAGHEPTEATPAPRATKPARKPAKSRQ